MNIEVEIRETYKGSQHYRLKIKPSGYGADHPGFVLVDAGLDYESKICNNLDVPVATFRPEYAKTIKRRLELGADELRNQAIELSDDDLANLAGTLEQELLERRQEDADNTNKEEE